MAIYVGTDVGGTFTDLWVSFDDGRSSVFKSPTTKDVLGGVINAIHDAAAAFGMSFESFCSQIVRFGHGTTVGLNALLTGNAAKTAILTTSGFADTLEIGRLRRQTSGMNEIEYTDSYLRNRFAPLIPRHLVFEVTERIDSNGEVMIPLDEDLARRVINDMAEAGVEAVAICTLWSTLNPVHELELKKLVYEILPTAFVSASHEISPAVGEYARMSTTAANAALGPLAGRYLSRLEETLRNAGMRVPVLMMTCAGGVLPTSILNDRPAYALFSGPAAGVIGSQAIGEKIGLKNLLTTDIGGTSFDVGVVVDGKPIMRSEIALAGADIRIHSIDVDSIGAGGGSIASVENGELLVGPRSAGANPGPVCYGRGGTEPTATDADLVLGILDANNFLGGRMKLNFDAAWNAIKTKIADPLGIDVIEAAWGIREILDSKMADLLRRVTIERGYDPRDFSLLANGGAGPSHAWMFSEELGLDGFIVPAVATAMSGYGTGNANLGISSERPVYTRLMNAASVTEESLAKIDRGLRDARVEVEKQLESAIGNESVEIKSSIAVRYRGQTHHLDVEVSASRFGRSELEQVLASFERQYETLFGAGATFSRAGYELLSVRAAGIASLSSPAAAAVGNPMRLIGTRNVTFRDPRKQAETKIYAASYPEAGAVIQGPAIIEYPGQSVVIPPGAMAKADAFGNLHVKKVK